jgi:LacI family transcriptional regulator
MFGFIFTKNHFISVEYNSMSECIGKNTVDYGAYNVSNRVTETRTQPVLKPPKNRRPTQRSIAQKLGLSVATVSRALSGDPLIALETRKLVADTANALGYVPDRAAQRLRTGRTNVISLVLPAHEEILGFGNSLVRGIFTALGHSHYHLVVMPTFDTEAADATVRRIVQNGLADGILLSRTEPNDIRIRYLIENDFPFVSHGRTELATPHPFVDFDNYGFAYQSVHRLVAAGADKLMILLPQEHLTFHHHLKQGFMAAVRETGVSYENISSVNLDSPPEDIAAAIKTRFAESAPPDGLILPGDTSALATLAALDDIGLKPGKDVFITTKQTSGAFDFVRPKIPSVFEDIAAAGELMAAYLVQRLEGAKAEDLQFVQTIEKGPQDE